MRMSKMSNKQNLVFTNRPKEIASYTWYQNKIRFDHFCLHPYTLKDQHRPGPNFQSINTSLVTNIKNFKPIIINLKSPPTRNLQYTLMQYESENNLNFIKNRNIPEIYCHSGFFVDLINNSSDTYRYVRINNKLFIVSTSTRKGQDKISQYAGVKFESYLTNQPDPVSNRDHTRVLLSGSWGKWNYKSAVEIDGYKIEDNGKRIENMTVEERSNSYAEFKLCFMEGASITEIRAIKSKREFLLTLRSRVRNFSSKLKKWLFQSYFGRQDKLIIGVRNKKWNLICYEEIDILDDLLPFIEEKSPILYQRFIDCPKILEQKITELYQHAPENQPMEFKTRNILAFSRVTDPNYTKTNIVIPCIFNDDTTYTEWLNSNLFSEKTVPGKDKLCKKEQPQVNFEKDSIKVKLNDFVKDPLKKKKSVVDRTADSTLSIHDKSKNRIEIATNASADKKINDNDNSSIATTKSPILEDKKNKGAAKNIDNSMESKREIHQTIKTADTLSDSTKMKKKRKRGKRKSKSKSKTAIAISTSISPTKEKMKENEKPSIDVGANATPLKVKENNVVDTSNADTKNQSKAVKDSTISTDSGDPNLLKKKKKKRRNKKKKKGSSDTANETNSKEDNLIKGFALTPPDSGISKKKEDIITSVKSVKAKTQ